MTFTRRDLLTVPLLAAGVVASGLWLIQAKHEARLLFVELEALNREQDRLQVEWGQLQIEQSTWSMHPRIESLAREELELAMPSRRQVVIIAEPAR
jgi:cell division protein FtsL